jgi:hypothetical protein
VGKQAKKVVVIDPMRFEIAAAAAGEAEEDIPEVVALASVAAAVDTADREVAAAAEFAAAVVDAEVGEALCLAVLDPSLLNY